MKYYLTKIKQQQNIGNKIYSIYIFKEMEDENKNIMKKRKMQKNEEKMK